MIVGRDSPDTDVGVGDVQLTVTAAGYDVPGISQAIDANAFAEWTECVGLVHADDGGLIRDNVRDVIQLRHSADHTYNDRAALPDNSDASAAYHYKWRNVYFELS